MIPYWIFAILIFTHVGLFVLGAAAYHAIRMLAVRPIYGNPTQKPGVSDARLMQMADKIARKQAQEALFNHMGPTQDPIVERSIPDGDGRPAKEEAFAPMVRK